METQERLDVIAATMRAASQQGLEEKDALMLQEIADQVEAWTVDKDWGCCPVCEEVACDDGCPMVPLRKGAIYLA